MGYFIRPLDLADDDELARAHDIFVAAWSYERPYADQPTLPEHLLEWRHIDAAERHDILGAFEREGGEMIGLAHAYYPLDDNTSKVWGFVTVAPPQRRRGIGTALMNTIAQDMPAAARSELVTYTCVPPGDLQAHPHYRFLAGLGFDYSHTEVTRRVMLPIDDDLLGRYADAARERYGTAYAIETYVGGVPEHRQEALCAAMNRLGVDAPTGQIDFEEESFTPARYREYLDLEQALKKVRITSIAVHRDTDLVTAFTDLMLPAGAPEHVHQWGTLVHGEHRGHRLGMAVKVANIRYLQEHYPEREHITTGNAETNKWMVAINEDLGFKILELELAFTKKGLS